MRRFASVVLVDSRGWLLLQERDEHPVIDPEKWGLVGGHVEEGEGFEQAAYRELAEETGLRSPPGSLRCWRELTVVHDAYGTDDAVQVWIGSTAARDADIVVGEGRRIVFVDPGRVADLDLTASARLALPPLLASADYRRLAGASARDHGRRPLDP